MNTCPTCDGGKKTGGLACPGAKWVEFPCFTCKGLGTISDEQMTWIANGKALRETRRLRGVSLREEAKRLNLAPAAYSDMEQGRIANSGPTE